MVRCGEEDIEAGKFGATSVRPGHRFPFPVTHAKVCKAAAVALVGASRRPHVPPQRRSRTRCAASAKEMGSGGFRHPLLAGRGTSSAVLPDTKKREPFSDPEAPKRFHAMYSHVGGTLDMSRRTADSDKPFACRLSRAEADLTIRWGRERAS